jgi:hypothetical protein
VALVFGLMLFQSRRFVEYFPPFALIFAAFAWKQVLSPSDQELVTGEKKNGTLSSPANFGRSLRSWLPVLILVGVTIPGMWLTTKNAQATIQDSKPTGTYSAAASWLEANTQAGSRVFQTDWDDFTRLFYHNTHNTYLVGLDPTYLQLYDARMYDEWVNITQGDVAEPSETIAGLFGAEYVFTDLAHDDFIDRAEEDPGLMKVYQDEEAIVYQVTP